MLNPSLHIHNSNSVIKDKRHRQKSHNEISVLNSLPQKQNIDGRLERVEQLIPLLYKKTILLEERNGYLRMVDKRKIKKLSRDGKL
jgi:hypothetical protein